MKIISYPVEKSIISTVKLYKNDIKKIVSTLLSSGYEEVNLSYGNYYFQVDEINDFVKKSKKEIVDELRIDAFLKDGSRRPEFVVNIDMDGVLIFSTIDSTTNHGLATKIHDVLNLKKRLSEYAIFGLSFFIIVLVLIILLLTKFFNKIGIDPAYFLITSLYLFIIPLVYWLAIEYFPNLKLLKNKIYFLDTKHKNFFFMEYKKEIFINLIINIVIILVLKSLYEMVNFIISLF